MSDAGSGLEARTNMNRRVNQSGSLGADTLRERLLDKYRQHLHFAGLKQSAGDRIGAENDLQHAEHFFRSAAEQTGGGQP